MVEICGSTCGKVYISTGTGSNTISDIIFRQNTNSTSTMDVMKISNNKVGITNTADAFTVEESPLHVRQSSTTGAVAAIRVEQNDVDKPFIKFRGQSTADSNSSLATSTATAAAKYGAIRISVDNKSATVEKWIRIYDSAV